MTPEDLPSLLRALHQENSERRPDCPDEHLIAAYVDGALGDDRREGIGEHLADCGHCLALVGLLSRERTANASQPVAELVVAPDHSRVRLESRRKGSSTPQWAAAAVVVVALGALVRLSQPMYPTGHSTTGSSAPTTRTAATSTQGLTLLSPRPGATVTGNELTVRWTPVPGSRFYDVRVVTDAGDVVTDQQVTGNQWRPTNLTALQPGAEYFVHVDAFIADDKTVSSEHVAFRVAK